jgi:hypothetical protein
MIKECYTPLIVGVNATATLPDSAIQVAGFLAATSGTLTITNQYGVVILSVPVTAGVYTPMPFSLRTGGDGTTMAKPLIVTSGGASGTLGY